MTDAWNTEDTNMSNPNGGDSGWSGNGQDRGTTPPPMNGRRNSRSRSPGPRRDDDRGRNEGGGINPGNNLHVSGLSSRVDSRDLEVTFSKFGKVAKAQVMYDPHTRESRGFGFVTMDTAAEADAATTAMNATEFKGRTITVEKARRGRARTPTPGRYFGPPKRAENGPGERPYDPRPYDSRYYDRPPPSRYDDDRRYGSRYDSRYDDRYPPPPSRYGGYDDRRGGGGGYDDRRREDYRRDYDRRY